MGKFHYISGSSSQGEKDTHFQTEAEREKGVNLFCKSHLQQISFSLLVSESEFRRQINLLEEDQLFDIQEIPVDILLVARGTHF